MCHFPSDWRVCVRVSVWQSGRLGAPTAALVLTAMLLASRQIVHTKPQVGRSVQARMECSSYSANKVEPSDGPFLTSLRHGGLARLEG